MVYASHKICACCKESKPIEEFYTRGKSLRGSYCKACVAVRARKSYETSFEDRLRLLFVSAKSRCKRVGREFSITQQDLADQFSKQRGLCFYTGEPLSLSVGRRDGKGVSVDRLNSNVGYVPGNIVLCSWRINQMKHKYTCDEFIEICKQVHLHNESKRSSP